MNSALDTVYQLWQKMAIVLDFLFELFIIYRIRGEG